MRLLNPLEALPADWATQLAPHMASPSFEALWAFVAAEREGKVPIYPPPSDVFNAFRYTPFASVKVVILGQDPYHGPRQAHGLCFSVKAGVTPPPSLVNMYKELNSDLGLPRRQHGNLEAWAQQGVLLLNSVMTVRAGQAGSHQGKGWEAFTDAAIEALNAHREGIVFLLWGAYAQKKAAFVDTTRHAVIKTTHPSPLSAHRGFLGSKPFSKANAYLLKTGQRPIDWQLPVTVPTLEVAE